MQLRHKRLLGLFVPPTLAIGVTTGYLTLTPMQFFSSPFYWAGLGIFALVGTFMYGSSKRGSKLPTYGKFAFVMLLATSIGLGTRRPEAFAFGFGFIGFLLGLAIKSTYIVSVRTRIGYCPRCGEVGWLSKKQEKWYCDRMGHEVNLNEAQKALVTITSGPAPTTPSQTKEVSNSNDNGEWFLGGFFSISLSKRPKTANYGVYATNRRIFGTFARLETANEFNDVVPRAVNQDRSSMMIRELERKKDIEIWKDAISNIELNKSPRMFRMGHLIIRTRSGQTLDVGLGKDKQYKQMQELMRAFYPQLIAS